MLSPAACDTAPIPGEYQHSADKDFRGNRRPAINQRYTAPRERAGWLCLAQQLIKSLKDFTPDSASACNAGGELLSCRMDTECLSLPPVCRSPSRIAYRMFVPPITAPPLQAEGVGERHQQNPLPS